jgi:hypothetical protein
MNYLIRLFFLILSTFSIFKFFFKRITTLSIFDYSEEFLLLFCFMIIFLNIWYKKKLALIHMAFIFFLIYSITISLLFGLNRNVIDIVVQSVVNIKFFIFLITFVMLFKNHIQELKNFLFLVLAFVALGLFLHLVLGTTFNSIYNVPTYARPNLRYTGFFRHPNHLAYVAIIFIALTLDSIKKRGDNINLIGWLKIIVGIGVVILSDSRTAFLAIAILFTLFYWDYVYKNAIVFLSFIFIGMLTVFLVLLFTDLSESIVSNFEMSYSLDSHYIRGLMLYMSSLLLIQYFPIGSGAGTFGSIFAHDSQVYKDFGVSHRYYFVEEWGIYDSNIASIIGEYGFIGIILFIILFRTSFKNLIYNFSGAKKAIMLKAMFWVFAFFCISNPMLTNSVYILLSVPVFLIIANTKEL